jgi:hypothetical protein
MSIAWEAPWHPGVEAGLDARAGWGHSGPLQSTTGPGEEAGEIRSRTVPPTPPSCVVVSGGPPLWLPALP